MKILKLAVVILGVLALTAPVIAAALEKESSVDGLSVKLRLATTEAVIGKNTISLDVMSNTGETLTDVPVSLYYFMPSMPAMNYIAPAEAKGKNYESTANLVMPGEWQIDVKIKLPHEDGEKVASFTLDVK